MDELKNALKQLIIETLDLEDITIDDIKDEEALFIDGLGLDSIDALELGLAIKKSYNITIDANSDDTKRHFSSINSLSEFVSQASA